MAGSVGGLIFTAVYWGQQEAKSLLVPLKFLITILLLPSGVYQGVGLYTSKDPLRMPIEYTLRNI